MFRGIGSDIRYVFRVLRRSPGFTLVAVLSLGLGLGANTAMYGTIRAVLLSPMPVAEPGQLALVTWRRPGHQRFRQINSTYYEDPDGGGNLRSNFSYGVVRALRDATPSGATLTAFTFVRGVSVSVGDQPALLASGAFTDGHYFQTVRPGMTVGRPLTEADDAPDAPLAVVLSHAFWMRAFGGDPAVVRRTVRVNGIPAQVVGVTAPGFIGLSMGGFFPRTEITIPLSAQPSVYPRMGADGSLFTADDNFWLRVFARLPDGVSRRSVASVYTASLRAVPGPTSAGDDPPATVKLLDGARGAQPVRGETATQLYILLAVVGMALLIACLNLASMMLARGVSRQRDMAVRRALGGGRVHLIRQTLLESLILAVAGTVLGLLLAYWGRGALAAALSGGLKSSAFGDLDLRMGLDPMVLLMNAGLAIGAIILFGLLPALRLSGFDPMTWLKQRVAGGATPRLGVGRGLIAFQVAVSVPLVAGALLFLRTIANLGAVPLGFDPTHLAMFRLDPGFTRLPEDQYPRIFQQVLANVQAIPGVRSATLVENALLSNVTSDGMVTLHGEQKTLYKNAVGPAFLETMAMRLLAGRMPGLQDVGDAPRVAAVNETAVKQLFDGVSPIGQMLRIGGHDVRIVGVVADSRYQSQRKPTPPTMYDAALQRTGWSGHYVVMRADVPISRLERAVRTAVAQVNPNLPVPELTSQTTLLAQSTAREHVFTELLTLFGAYTLLLASIGLYGVTAYSVTRRTTEIGVRVAVGARPAHVLWLVMRQVVILAAIGLAVGLPLALAAGRSIRSLLYGVAADNPLVLALAALLMLAVAVIAGLVPAWRATRLDPLTALRVE